MSTMKRYAPILLGVMIGNALPALAEETPHSYKPVSGYVPDAETAIRIAVAIWEPIYGREIIEAEKPYRASLMGGVWVVEGSLAPGCWVAWQSRRFQKQMQRFSGLVMASEAHNKFFRP